MGSQLLTGALDLLQSGLIGPADSGNAPVMLMVGTFKFSLNTAMFQQMQRTSEYRWASIERFGDVDAQQFTGYGDDVITLPGVIYPDFKGGVTQIGKLRHLAEQGRPQRVMTAAGVNAGYFTIQRITDTREFFKPNGDFLKQEFSVSLKFYGVKLP